MNCAFKPKPKITEKIYGYEYGHFTTFPASLLTCSNAEEKDSSFSHKI